MISFVWSSRYPFWAGAGGSENYTAGHIRELMRRGIPTRVLTLGHGKRDGREDFPDIAFKALHSKQQLSLLDDTLVYVTYPLNVRTKKSSFAVLHCPPLSLGQPDPLFDKKGIKGTKLIAASRFSALMWERDLGLDWGDIPVAYPFADSEFAAVRRRPRLGHSVRILFSGRLTPDKGVYTLLAAMHIMDRMGVKYRVTATTSGAKNEEGKIVHALFQAHPRIKLVPAGNDAAAVADLMAKHDIVVMPSTDIFWKELFGMVSVEAQHAGCRVVASNSGGLPETDCGGLMLVEPDNPKALAEGLAKAAKLGALNEAERKRATTVFTVAESVDQLLDIVAAEEAERADVRSRSRRPVHSHQGVSKLFQPQPDYQPARSTSN
jgi:glycosyltransferase involved in cell wall biosynthesis